MGIGPFRQVVPRPTVEIESVAASMHHAINRRRAADHLTPGTGHPPPVHAGFGIGVIGPVEAIILQGPGQASRDPEHQGSVGPAASRRRTDIRGSSVIRLAITQPAEPAPTMM